MCQYIEILEWDSEFFGFPVACLKAASHPTEAFSELRVNRIRLAYWFVPLEQRTAEHPGITKVVHADTKLTFASTADLSSESPNAAIFHSSRVAFPRDELHRLAIQAGHCSRFAVDSNMPTGAFQRLYRTWIDKCLDRELPYEVYFAVDGRQLAGFVTVGEESGRADIGLLGVDPQFRGKGIGTELVRFATQVSRFPRCQVVTQQNNIGACRLYRKCGFEVVATEYVYHVWLDSVPSASGPDS